MSPASGDLGNEVVSCYHADDVSIQLMSPASGDVLAKRWTAGTGAVSIQLMSPASGDCELLNGSWKPIPTKFPFN